MATRREFFKSTAKLGVLSAGSVVSPSLAHATAAMSPPPVQTGIDDRQYWLSVVERIGRPVLTHLAQRTLRISMPVEAAAGVKDRNQVTHLEAFGRLIYGIAPWLELDGLTGKEGALQKEFRDLAQRALDAASDPKSPDYLNFTRLNQPLVDAAFLAQGIQRAPNALWKSLDARVKSQLVEALKSTRQIPTPSHNNWVMFAATVEAALLEFGEPTEQKRLEDCVRKMLEWYCGDGMYGDGEFFHFDYYNSFVIHPMLLDVLTILAKHDAQFAPACTTVRARAQRYAVIQERLIAPDGSFPAIGRSLAYRFGVFQLLSQIALRHELPNHLKPAQVRCAMTAVIRRMIEAAGTFDSKGWLQIGFCGHQPAIGEGYISTGSLYLCSAGLLALGLPPSDAFWAAPSEPWSSQQLWSGQNLATDHAMGDTRKVLVPNLERSEASTAPPVHPEH